MFIDIDELASKWNSCCSHGFWDVEIIPFSMLVRFFELKTDLYEDCIPPCPLMVFAFIVLGAESIPCPPVLVVAPTNELLVRECCANSEIMY